MSKHFENTQTDNQEHRNNGGNGEIDPTCKITQGLNPPQVKIFRFKSSVIIFHVGYWNKTRNIRWRCKFVNNMDEWFKTNVSTRISTACRFEHLATIPDGYRVLCIIGFDRKTCWFVVYFFQKRVLFLPFYYSGRISRGPTAANNNRYNRCVWPAAAAAAAV